MTREEYDTLPTIGDGVRGAAEDPEEGDGWDYRVELTVRYEQGGSFWTFTPGAPGPKEINIIDATLIASVDPDSVRVLEDTYGWRSLLGRTPDRGAK